MEIPFRILYDAGTFRDLSVLRRMIQYFSVQMIYSKYSFYVCLLVCGSCLENMNSAKLRCVTNVYTALWNSYRVALNLIITSVH